MLLMLARPSVAGATLVLFVVTASLAVYFGRVGAVLLAGVSLSWLMVNAPMEGRTLFVLSYTHGVTEADLASIAGFAMAVVVWFIPPRRPPK